jgi:hypothetical protein
MDLVYAECIYPKVSGNLLFIEVKSPTPGRVMIHKFYALKLYLESMDYITNDFDYPKTK